MDRTKDKFLKAVSTVLFIGWWVFLTVITVRG